MLACYRKNCAQAITAGELILPETWKLLPGYVASLLNSDALTGKDNRDFRMIIFSSTNGDNR